MVSPHLFSECLLWEKRQDSIKTNDDRSLTHILHCVGSIVVNVNHCPKWICTVVAISGHRPKRLSHQLLVYLPLQLWISNNTPLHLEIAICTFAHRSYYFEKQSTTPPMICSLYRKTSVQDREKEFHGSAAGLFYVWRASCYGHRTGVTRSPGIIQVIINITWCTQL